MNAETSEAHTNSVYARTVVDVFMPKIIYTESTNFHSPFLRIEKHMILAWISLMQSLNTAWLYNRVYGL